MEINYNGVWKLLIDNELNKKQLADKAGISPATISKMGRGEMVSLEVLYKIGVVLDADFGQLVSMKKSKDQLVIVNRKI